MYRLIDEGESLNTGVYVSVRMTLSGVEWFKLFGDSVRIRDELTFLEPSSGALPLIWCLSHKQPPRV